MTRGARSGALPRRLLWGYGVLLVMFMGCHTEPELALDMSERAERSGLDHGRGVDPAPLDMSASVDSTADSNMVGDMRAPSRDMFASTDMSAPEDMRERSQAEWRCDHTPLTTTERQVYTREAWANLQFPSRLRTLEGEPSDPVYGQLWLPGVTEEPGATSGWSAEVLVGPLGTHPHAHGECWQRVVAAYNVDVGNNDEYTAPLRVDAPGLFSYMMRYSQGADQPALLGDLDGLNDGSSADRAGVLEVAPASRPDELVVVTLNLRCQADDWPARRLLVLDALARLSPDLIALQEDCAALGQAPQSRGLRGALAARTGRGYAWRRVVTHQADHDGVLYDEGLALLSAWPLDELVEGGVVDLPHVHFPRKALAWTMRVGDVPVHVLATHFDYSRQAAVARDESAALLLQVLPESAHAVLLGDLNATPDSAAYATLDDDLRDLWVEAHPGDAGATIPAHAPTRRIDYIFASGAFGPVREAVLLDEHRGGTWLSDHLGLATSITLIP